MSTPHHIVGVKENIERYRKQKMEEDERCSQLFDKFVSKYLSSRDFVEQLDNGAKRFYIKNETFTRKCPGRYSREYSLDSGHRAMAKTSYMYNNIIIDLVEQKAQ